VHCVLALGPFDRARRRGKIGGTGVTHDVGIAAAIHGEADACIGTAAAKKRQVLDHRWLDGVIFATKMLGRVEGGKRVPIVVGKPAELVVVPAR